jgi:hypothetical protein
MALPLPERWRAPMGVIAGGAMRSQFLGLALLEFSRDLLIAKTCFQSEFLERPNAKVKGRPCEAWTSHLNDLLGRCAKAHVAYKNLIYEVPRSDFLSCSRRRS